MWFARLAAAGATFIRYWYLFVIAALISVIGGQHQFAKRQALLSANEVMSLRNEMNLQTQAAMAADRLATELEAKLAKAEASAARVEIRYRDRIREVEVEVIPEECKEADAWAIERHNEAVTFFNSPSS